MLHKGYEKELEVVLPLLRGFQDDIKKHDKKCFKTTPALLWLPPERTVRICSG